MNITVSDVDGLPAHTFISVRCGETRKQAPFRTGEVLSFPPTGGAVDRQPKAFTVDILRKVGSKQVSLAGISALGGVIKHENLVIPSLEIQGSPVTASFTARLTEPNPTESEDNKKQMVAVRAKQYLERHGVQTVLHEMFAQLLERLPNDPLAFMIDFLEQQQEEAEEAEGRVQTDPRVFAIEPGLGEAAFPGYGPDQELPDLSQHHSIMADVLRKDMSIVPRLGHLRTGLGVTLAQCIKPGVDCPGHELVKVAGISAGDAECYELFKDMFNPVIAALHTGWTPNRLHLRDTDPAKLTTTQIDPTGRYAIFASIETRRNFQRLRLTTCCSKEERREVERVVTKVLEAARGELKGTYYPLRMSDSYAQKLGGMTLHQEDRLRGVGLLFSEPDSRMRLSAGLGRHWPDARGVFVGETQGLYLWCNEEDHLRFFARQHTVVDLKKLWGRLDRVVRHMEEGAASEGHGFSFTDRLGYTTTDPSRLGAALRISVSLKVPLLAATADLPGLCRTLDLHCTQELGSASHGGMWNVSSTDSLGISEVDLVNLVINGCATLVSLEQRLEQGHPVYDAMPGLGSEPYPGFPVDRCPERMPDLSAHHSVMANVLKAAPAIYDQLREKRTPSGVSFAACIKPGMDDRSYPKVVTAGMVAGDEASYEHFQELFYPVINQLNGCIVGTKPHPFDLSPSALSENQIDPTGSSVVSVRVELRRNIRGLRLAPCCDKNERRLVEQMLVKGMVSLSGAYRGEYLPLTCSESYASRPGGIPAADQSRLIAEEAIFGEPAGLARLAAGLGRHWPDARGAFVTQERDLNIWCNEEDHLRFITMLTGGNLHAAFARVAGAAQDLQAVLAQEGREFMWDSRLGFLTVDPTNVGNGFSCFVTLRLPQLSTQPEFFPCCHALGLRTQWRRDAWEFSVGPRVGFSEVQMANFMIEICAQLVDLEHKLRCGTAVESELRALRNSQLKP